MFDSLFENEKYSRIYSTILLAFAAVIVLLNQEVNGAVLFLLITSAALIVSSRLTDAMLPAMLLAVFVTRCYDSADVFMARAWAAAPAVFAVIFHFVQYKKKLRLGRSFYGLCAVTVAVTLGGLGTIPTSDYFYPTALFYVFGLGAGMVLFYLLVKSQLHENSAREIAKIMYAVGILASFCVIRFYATGWESFIEAKKFIYFQSSNNLSTFLMLAMPFPMYFASKRQVHLLSVILMYVCTVFTGSRGGIFMGTVEFVIILFAYAFFYRRIRVRRYFYLGFILVFVVVMIFAMPTIMKLSGVKIDLGDVGGHGHGQEATFMDYVEKLKAYLLKKETRAQLLDRMFGDFTANPIFGVGIGYTGNSDIYSPVKGAMNWYHMWLAQVIGGLGVVGIIAYFYQLYERIKIFFKNKNLLHMTFLLSYIGLFLMSQVNPGEFCPMPYAALAVTYFLLMEEDIALPKRASDE